MDLDLFVTNPEEHTGRAYHLRDELDDEILQEIDAFRVWILVVAEAVHHTPEFFREDPLLASGGGYLRVERRIRVLVIVLKNINTIERSD